MNNLQQFLEEEFKDYGVRMSEDEDHFEFESPSPSKILDFTNKVLDEVKREVEKEYEKIVDNRHPELGDAGANCECGQCMFSCGKKFGMKDISTIIDQLKLK